MQSCRRALPSAWGCLGQEGLGIFCCPTAQRRRGTAVPMLSPCCPRGAAGLLVTLLVYGLAEELQRGKSHWIPCPLQHPWLFGEQDGFPSKPCCRQSCDPTRGRVGGSPRAALQSLSMLGLWGAPSLGVDPQKGVTVSTAGSGLGVQGSSPLRSGGSATPPALCLHGVDEAVKSRLLQKRIGHS